MKLFNRLSVFIVGALLSASLIVGCNGCKQTLEGGGAYSPGVTMTVTNADNTVSNVFTPSQRPDMELFVTDSLFALSYSGLDLVFNLEKNNRDWLFKQAPDIKHGLDAARPKAAEVVRGYTKARKAYIANPTPAGLDLLKNILAEAQRLATSVQGVIPANIAPTAPVPK